MDSLFFIKLIISFFLGGLYVILASITADRFGSKIGGLISGLPSTITFGLLFIAWTQSPAQAVGATTIFPIIEGIDCLFIASYCYFIKKGLLSSLAISYLLWFILSFGLVLVKFNSYGLSLAGYLLFLLVSYIFLEKIIKINSLPGKKIHYTKMTIILRGLLSGLIIALTVFVGKVGGPIWGGVFSGFPAMITSTMIITYLSQGADFSAGTMKSMMISVGGIVIYSMAVRYSYPTVGIIWGTMFSLVISYISSIFLYKFIINKIS